MGDRALVQFVNSNGCVSPVIYLHEAGHKVAELLLKHHALMAGRYSDVGYSAARFIGMCHSDNPNSNLSLGCWDSGGEQLSEDDTHGDAGVFVINVDDKSITMGGGYGLVINRDVYITTSHHGAASAYIDEDHIVVPCVATKETTNLIVIRNKT